MVHKYKWHIAAVAVFVCVLIIVHYLGLFNNITLTALQQRADQLHNFVQQHSMLSIILFCVLFISAMLLFLPITVVLTIAAGFLFGVGVGTLLVLFSATLGGSIIFLLVRHVIGRHVQKRYVASLQTFNADIKKYGSSYLLVLQLLPVTPTFVINLFAGVSPISLWTYVWTTCIGIAPGTLVYAFAGNHLHLIRSVNDIMSWPAIIILCLLAVLALIPMLIQRYVLQQT